MLLSRHWVFVNNFYYLQNLGSYHSDVLALFFVGMGMGVGGGDYL